MSTMEFWVFATILGLGLFSRIVLGLNSPDSESEGRFPILMPDVHPYKVSVLC